jgi:hexosaminidase
MPDLVLLPFPKKILRGRGVYRVPAGDKPAVELIRDNAVAHDQGYRLTISPTGVQVRASAPAGAFYAVTTLTQIARQCGRRWPCLTIEDFPDFPRRGFYHDVSRGKVPKLATLLQLVDDLAALKINEFQLYIENVYAFQRHPAMYDDTTPLTAKDLQTIDKACRERFIDFVPSLTSLGHFDKILRRPQYRHLAEAEPADLKKAGIKTWSDDPWSLCVTDPGSKRLLKEMYDEFLPNFTSKQFNICCDESWDLGKGRSKKRAEKIGAGKLYVDWVRYCQRLAAAHGRKVQMWGDIILRHPELIPTLPKDATLLEWGYEADHPFAEHCALFAKSGRPFYVAPGTSTWLTFAGRTQNAFECMRNAARAGLQHGAAGFLNTDWGDHGHQQLLAVSLLPMAFGAAISWNQAGATDRQVIRAGGMHVFRAANRGFSQVVAALGQTYQRIGVHRPNGSVDWFLFREPWNTCDYLTRVKPADLRKTIVATKRLLAGLAGAQLNRTDGKWIVAEMALTARTIIYSAERALARLAMANNSVVPDRPLLRRLLAENRKIAKEFRRLWLLRNRPSRLADVLYHFSQQEVELNRAIGSQPRSFKDK